MYPYTFQIAKGYSGRTQGWKGLFAINAIQHSLDGYLLKDNKNNKIVSLKQTTNEAEERD